MDHDEDSKINDVDFYFANEEVFKKAVTILEKSNYFEEGNTERAVTYYGGFHCPRIQLIKFVYGTLTEVLEEFDFTIVKAGISSTKLVEHNDYHTNLEYRLLRYTGSRLPLASLARASKYVKYGYKFPALEMVAIVKDINAKVDLSDAVSVRYHIESFDPLRDENEETEDDF